MIPSKLKPHLSLSGDSWRCVFAPSYWLPRIAVGFGPTPAAAYRDMLLRQPVAAVRAVLGQPAGVLGARPAPGRGDSSA